MRSSLGIAVPASGDDVELVVDVSGVRLGEDGPDGRGDHLGRALGDLGEDVSEEVDPAALDSRAGHDRLDCLAQAKVGVGDHQLHPGQAAGLERAEERGPEGAVLAGTHGEAENFAAAVTAHPGRDPTAWETTRRLTRALQ
jgi:hypothetical protein